MPNPLLDNIRIATANDADDLAAIRTECFHEKWSVKTFADMLENSDSYCLCIPGIAYALAQKIPPESELITIAVIPTFRRQNIAENLLQRLWQELQVTGTHTLHLEVNEKLTGARQLYQKLGFTETGRRKEYYLDSSGIRHDAILMQLRTAL